MANLITGSRILLSLLMWFVPIGSYAFYGCYLLAGLTDMIDDTVARLRGETNAFGARFDTVADMVFTIVSICRFLPLLHLPLYILIWAGGIAVVKVVNSIAGYVISKQFLSVHSAASRVTGFLLFLFPLSAVVIDNHIK